MYDDDEEIVLDFETEECPSCGNPMALIQTPDGMFVECPVCGESYKHSEVEEIDELWDMPIYC